MSKTIENWETKYQTSFRFQVSSFKSQLALKIASENEIENEKECSVDGSKTKVLYNDV